MNKPYLVQRMSFQLSPPAEASFDQLLSMQYMGSAEYEWGALPKSLKRICSQVEQYRICMTPLKSKDGQVVYLICQEELFGQYLDDGLKKLAKDELNLKERARFMEALLGEMYNKPYKGAYEAADAWWDIDNDVLWTFGEDQAKRILSAIIATRDRKRAEGASGWY